MGQLKYNIVMLKNSIGWYESSKGENKMNSTIETNNTLENKDAKYWINKGREFYMDENYENAIKCYEKAAQLDPNEASVLNRKKAKVFRNWGCTLYNLAENKKDKERENLLNNAFEKYEEAVRLYKADLDKAVTYCNWGNVLYNLAKTREDYVLFEKMFEKYEEAIRLYKTDIDKATTYYNWGNALRKLAEIKQDKVLFNNAFEKYKEAVRLCETDKNASIYKTSILNNWGYALYKLAEINKDENLFQRAFEKYKETIRLYEISKDVVGKSAVLNNWGNALRKLAEIKQDENLFQEAFKKYDEAVKLEQKNADRAITFNNWGIAFYSLAEIKQNENLFQKAVEYFIESKKDTLSIFVILFSGNKKRIFRPEYFYKLLDDDAFFSKTIKKDETKSNKYKDIYLRSLFIISQLHINREYEKSVAYYTKKIIAQKLLFYESKFRLNAIDNSNDPTEGKTLLDYLFPSSKENLSEKEIFDTEYRAFVGCFTFQHDSLNQFRLYGKDNDKEGTGLSLVFHEDFFSKELRLATEEDGKKDRQNIDILSNNEEENKKYTLFRCIYIDPKKQQVKTVGHKETTDEKYKKYIDDVFDIVNEKMKELRNLIDQNPNLDRNVIELLLINLRYLTKHIAFKEEQECRIVRICSINGKNKIHFEEEKMYIEYESDILYKSNVSSKPDVISRIEKIYFGPKATNIESFQDRLKINKLDGKIKCDRSENPLA
jgi:tetratricopeptide (TPR) repeat protein